VSSSLGEKPEPSLERARLMIEAERERLGSAHRAYRQPKTLWLVFAFIFLLMVLSPLLLKTQVAPSIEPQDETVLSSWGGVIDASAREAGVPPRTWVSSQGLSGVVSRVLSSQGSLPDASEVSWGDDVVVITSTQVSASISLKEDSSQLVFKFKDGKKSCLSVPDAANEPTRVSPACR
jgi:hypothetical protein